MLLKRVLVQYQQLHEALFGPEFAVAPLLQPQESLQRQMEREIGHLAQTALAAPEVLAWLTASGARVALNQWQTEAGRKFEQQLQAFLSAHGRRHDGRDLMAPTWREDPTPVLKRIQEAAQQGQSLGSASSDQLLEQVHQRLASHPREARRAYMDLLGRARGQPGAGRVSGTDAATRPRPFAGDPAGVWPPLDRGRRAHQPGPDLVANARRVAPFDSRAAGKGRGPHS